jgi:hypothetical protein
MGVVSGLALVLLTLVGYSSGVVLAGRGRQAIPGLLDAAVVVVLWAAALATRVALGRGWAVLFWFVAGLMVGGGLAGVRRGEYLARRQEVPAAVQEGGGRWRRWWQRWQVFAARMGNYQGRVLLIFFYFVVVTPFGVLLRLWGDPLRLRRAGGGSFWLEREVVEPGLEKAREQF